LHKAAQNLNSYQIFKVKKKHKAVDVLLKGAIHGTNLMQIQSGRTVPLSCLASVDQEGRRDVADHERGQAVEDPASGAAAAGCPCRFRLYCSGQ
jgi:hypothetical protein